MLVYCGPSFSVTRLAPSTTRNLGGISPFGYSQTDLEKWVDLGTQLVSHLWKSAASKIDTSKKKWGFTNWMTQNRKRRPIFGPSNEAVMMQTGLRENHACYLGS